MAGVLAIANGGTNSTAATLGGVGYGTGSAHAYTPVGIAGQVLSAAEQPLLKTLEMTDIPGAAYKATCRVASTANITTLSVLTIDGIVLANDRVLVKDQTSQNNGIYLCWSWVRSVGANVSSEINTAIVTIDLGTVNTGSIFY
jgi:hypothetical protein